MQGGAATLALPERYQVVRKLGRGGMGVVYEVNDTTRGHDVALKTLRHPSADALYRLKREFRSLADLSHPNLIELYDLVVSKQASFFTMELVHGVDFVSHCRGRSFAAGDAHVTTDPAAVTQVRAAMPVTPAHADPLEPNDYTDPAMSTELDGADIGPRYDETRLRSALAQLTAGVQVLHGVGAVHRDLKPSNVLVTDDGRVVVLDFGLVRATDRSTVESLDGELVGTVAYMSPEQASQSGELSAASDWYSVGVILFEVLTGQLPFTGSIVQQLTAKQGPLPHSPQELNPDVPDDLDKLCVELLRVEPDRRPGGDRILRVLRGHSRGPVTTEATETTVFSGREAELEVLRDAMASVRDDQAVIAHVHGPSGIGKSAIISEFLAQVMARRPDTLILRGRCYEREFVPFKAVDGLVDGLSRAWRRMDEAEAISILPRLASSLSRLFPVLARVPCVANSPVLPEVSDPLEARQRAFDALREVFQRLADRRRVVLFLDDMQWVDMDTITLLTELMRPPDAPRVLLLLSQRVDAGAENTLTAALDGMGGHRVSLPVQPMDTAQAEQLVRTLLGELDRAGLQRLIDEAGGSPFLLSELAHYLKTTGSTDLDAIQLERLVEDRIALLPAEARLLLEVVAVAGEPVRSKELATAAGVDQMTATRNERLLRVNHLIRRPGGRGDDRVEPYHDRIRTALRALLPDERVKEIHRALAIVLQGSAPPGRLARHWAAAGERERAAAYALRAAAETEATFDFEHSVALYKTALELGSYSDDEQRRLYHRLANALVNAGRSSEAGDAYLAAADGAPAVERIELRRHAAQQLLCAGYIPRGLDVLAQVLEEIGEVLPNSTRRAIAGLVWHDTRLRLRGLSWTLRDESEISPRVLSKLDVYASVGMSLGMVDTPRAAMYQARALRLALRTGERHRLYRALGYYAVFLGTRSLFKRADRHIAAMEQLLGDDTDPVMRFHLPLARGYLLYFRGSYAAGADTLGDAERILTEEVTGFSFELSSGRIMRSLCIRLTGDYTLLTRLRHEYLRDARQRGDHYFETTLLRAFNIVWLAADDVDSARADLEQSSWSAPAGAYHLQHWYSLRARGEIELYTQGDQPVEDFADEFGTFYDALVSRVLSVRTEVEWLQARLALAGGTADPAKLGKRLRKRRLPQTDAWAAAIAAGVAHRNGNSNAADVYEQAGATASASALPALAAACQRRCGELRGDDAMIASADAALSELGAKHPERMSLVLAPRPVPPR